MPIGFPRRAALALGEPRAALAVATIVLSSIACIDVLNDPDLWWHLRTGAYILDTHSVPAQEMYSYTATGHPWTPHSWLFEVVYALLDRTGGLLLVALVVAAISWSGFIALAIRSRLRGAGALPIALAIAIGAAAAEPVLGTRTQIATFACTCWMLLIVESFLQKGGRRRWLLPPLFLLWANLHAGFVAGLAVLIAVTVIELIRTRTAGADARGRARQLAVVALVCVLAACITPFGPRLLLFGVTSSTANFQKLIVEWASPDFHNRSLYGLLLFIAALVGLRRLASSHTARDAVLDTAGVVLALLAVRNASFLVALSTPSVAAALHDTLERHRPLSTPSGRHGRPPQLILAVVLLALASSLVGVKVATAAHDASPAGVARAFPTCAADALGRASTPVRVFAPYFYGGFLIDRQWPHVRVYAYGESEALGQEVLDDYSRSLSGTTTAPSALELLDRSSTNAVLVGDGGLSTELAQSAQWRRTVVDDVGMHLWVRTSATWGANLASC